MMTHARVSEKMDQHMRSDSEYILGIKFTNDVITKAGKFDNIHESAKERGTSIDRISDI